MFKKVHLRLAILCGGITAVILLFLSVGYLYVSEQSLKSSSFTSFQNDMDTLLGNLENRTVITHEWLNKMENNGKYKIQIIDNGIPFLYNERKSEEDKQLFQEVLSYYENMTASTADSAVDPNSDSATNPTIGNTADSTADSASDILQENLHNDAGYTENQPDSASASSELSHTEFSFSSKESQKKDYYVSIASAQHKNSILWLIVIASQDALNEQIRRQRVLFFILDILAVSALFLFAWYFTKKILRPLQENQEKQIQFVASASHELRTPLAAILSCASASEKADANDREHFLASIQSEGKRMSKLIDEMLLLTTAEENGQEVRMNPVEPDTLLLNTYEAFEPIAAEKSITLSISLPENAACPVVCDAERIRQVLIILLTNAVNYTPYGGKIHLSLSQTGKNTRFSVADNGIGVPDSEKQRIFERFYRADKSRSQKGHFGLGLCIAAEIMKAHHGRILVSDTPGGGATFTILL